MSSPPTLETSSQIIRWLTGRIAEEIVADEADVDPDAHFSEYGLDSLSRFVLAGELSERLEAEISPTLLWECSTIREVAELCASGGEAGSDSTPLPRSIDPEAPQVIPLQPRGDKPPLICIAGIDLYSSLAEQFAPDRPVYGIYVPAEVQAQDEELKGSSRPQLTVEELASRYVVAISSIRSSGPVHLAGISFGGVLAFEIAHQLRRQQTDVGEVLLFDSILPRGVRRLPVQRALHLVGKALRVGPRETLCRIRQRIRLHSGMLARVIDGSGSEDRADEAERISAARLRFFWEVVKKYDPPPYDGSVTLFRALESNLFGRGYEVEAEYGWKGLVAGGLPIREVPGSHLGILEPPHVEKLAKLIREQLRSTEPATSSVPNRNATTPQHV